MQRILFAAALVGLLTVGLVPMGQSGSEEVEVGRYIGGGSFMGTGGVCSPQVLDNGPEDLKHGVGRACDIRCPGGTCSIEVVDDVWGHFIGFRVCVDGEDFCRPNRFIGWGYVEAPRVTVVPQLDAATHGIVYVR